MSKFRMKDGSSVSAEFDRDIRGKCYIIAIMVEVPFTVVEKLEGDAHGEKVLELIKGTDAAKEISHFIEQTK